MITLTYNDENIPKGKKIDTKTGEITGESYTLKKRDVELFNKRLRKKYKDIKFKMLGCGEYGGKNVYYDRTGERRVATERPHYHIIYFGIKPDDLIFHKWAKCDWNKTKNPLYRSNKIEKLWYNEETKEKMGNVELNEVNYETINYVCGYVTKKWKGKGSEEHYAEKGQLPEYLIYSKGIGKDFFEKNKEKFWNQEKMYVAKKNKIVELKSRYFDKLLEKEDEERFKKIKEKRKEAQIAKEEWIKEHTDVGSLNYFENREYIVESKNKFAKIRNLK